MNYKLAFFSLSNFFKSIQEVSHCLISGIRLYDRYEIGVSGTFLVFPLNRQTDILKYLNHTFKLTELNKTINKYIEDTSTAWNSTCRK